MTDTPVVARVHVLVVEDDDAMRLVLTDALEQCGYAVDGFGDGYEGYNDVYYGEDGDNGDLMMGGEPVEGMQSDAAESDVVPEGDGYVQDDYQAYDES